MPSLTTPPDFSRRLASREVSWPLLRRGEILPVGTPFAHKPVRLSRSCCSILLRQPDILRLRHLLLFWLSQSSPLAVMKVWSSPGYRISAFRAAHPLDTALFLTNDLELFLQAVGCNQYSVSRFGLRSSHARPASLRDRSIMHYPALSPTGLLSELKPAHSWMWMYVGTQADRQRRRPGD